MKAFMDKDFLLETETAGKLFHEYAEVTPILDYHCHITGVIWSCSGILDIMAH